MMAFRQRPESNVGNFAHTRQAILPFGLRYFQIITSLQIQPILRRLSQSAAKPQSQFRCDRARAFEHMRHAHRRNANRVSEGGLGQIQVFEYFMQTTARMNRRQTIGDHAVIACSLATIGWFFNAPGQKHGSQSGNSQTGNRAAGCGLPLYGSVNAADNAG